MEWNDLAIQQKWQQRWSEAKAFEPQKEKGKEKFFFTVPYPYVSGLLHVGHGRTYTNGDVIARFKRMRGFNVLWPMAFHITGTPVLAISAKIQAGDAETVKMFEEYAGIYEKDAGKVKQIVSSFTDPWKLVNYFSGKLVNDFSSMGYSLDFSRQFTTGDAEYNKFIEWQFHKYKQKGYLKQAGYPILYCVRDKNAVGEDDIKDADTLPVEMQHFVSFKYKLEGSDAYLITCTLRPDTAYGILNLYANPATLYVKALVWPKDGKWKEQWIVSRQFCEKISAQGYEVKIIEEISGNSLIGKWCVDHFGNRRPIFPANFADPDICSGIVHSSARAPVDYLSLQELKTDDKTLLKYPGLREQVNSVEIPHIVDLPGFGPVAAKDMVEKIGIRNSREADKIKKATVELYRLDHQFGVMTELNGPFAGMKVSEAKLKIAEFLKKEGKSMDFYEVSRPASCRCGGKVVCAVLSDQWFLDYNAPGWKKLARECLDGMTIYPQVYRKQFEDVFAWLDKRPCARRRGLGTKLPFDQNWIIESLSDSTIYMALYTIIKSIRELGISPEQLQPEFFDYVFLSKGDAGKVAKQVGCEKEVVEKVREEFLYWYPNDLRHTGIAHITNHLSFFIFAHASLFGKEHWPKAISLNEFVLSEGSKMSKSKGNVVLLNYIAREGMADVFRFYSAGAADFQSVLDYRARDVEIAKKNLSKLVSTILELIELNKSRGASTSKDSSGNAYSWMASKFEKSVRDSTKALEEFRLRDYVQLCSHNLLKDYEYFSKRASEQEKKSFASQYASKWIALIAPLVPHAAEELWERSGEKEFVSLSQWPAAQEKAISLEVELCEDLVGQVISDARSIVQMLSRKGKKFSKLTVIVSSASKWEELLAGLKKDSPEKASEGINEAVLMEFVQKEFYALQYRLAGQEKQLDEKEVLEQAKEFVEKELCLQFSVEAEEKSSHAKASKAMPLKPAIVLE